MTVISPSVPTPAGDVMFSPAVKRVQERLGSRAAYQRREERGGFRTKVTPDLAAFLAERDSFYLGTASADGQPYIQHRGGSKGFLRVLDDQTLGFAEFGGNKQYITAGNLEENDRAYIFLMDYQHRRRVKLWGRARVTEDPEIIKRLMQEGYDAEPERAVLFTIAAWDTNCNQHIPQKFDAPDVAAAIDVLRGRIAEVEAENARLKAELEKRT
ncbi:MAG: pyridoxamine 5'-phosphate oxidase family protein [Alphaproteobacteria bacterium]|nr:pyridoxamine 5'-phosphate oxidase family protein [Alphaproteobacteria bacterium]